MDAIVTRGKPVAAMDGRDAAVCVPGVIPRLLLGAAFFVYFTGTVAVYFWGPWDYPMPAGRGRLIAFLVAVHVAFALGYWRGIRRMPAPARWLVPINALVLAAAALELLLLFPTSALNTGHWIPSPWAALHDLGDAYTNSLAVRDRATPYVNYVRMLTAPLLAIAVPWGVFYWRRLSWVTRILFGGSVVGTIALFVAMGANAGAAHWMMLFPWFVLAGHLSGIQRLDRAGWVAAALVQVLSIGLFAGLFAATMTERHGSFAKYGSISKLGVRLEGAPAPQPRSAVPSTTAVPLPRLLPSPSRSAARIGADGLAGYLTQGYFAVYLSLQEPFVPSYGVGNSMFLQRQAARLFHDPSILDRPYPDRIEKHGWNAYGNWATIYPWIASDVTFPGTVVVMFLIGWLTARVWLDVLGGQNPFAVAFLGQLLVLLYYVPAHNKVMQSGEGVVAFWVLCAVWWFMRGANPAARPSH